MRQLILTVLIMALVGCKKEQMQPQEKSIGFTSAVLTKGVSINTENISNFGVYGYATEHSTWGNVAATATPNLFNNIKVTKTDNVWSYGTPIKWTGYLTNFTFFGYSPYAALGNGVEIPETNTTGVPALNFTVQPNANNQVDLLVAEVIDTKATSKPVQMGFKHSLSRICFKAFSTIAGNSIYIKKITITKLKHKATLTMNDGGTWNSKSALIDCVLTYTTPLLVEGTTAENATDLSVNDNCFMMLPQDLSNGQGNTTEIIFTYTVGTETEEKIKSYIAKELWERGKSVNYTVDLTTNISADLIVNDVTITDWNKGAEEEGNADGSAISVNLTYGTATPLVKTLNESVLIEEDPGTNKFWNTKADGSGIFYAQGERILMETDITLHSVANELVVNGVTWAKKNLATDANGNIIFAGKSEKGSIFKWGSVNAYKPYINISSPWQNDNAGATECTVTSPEGFSYDYVDLAGGANMGDPCMKNIGYRTPTKQEFLDLITVPGDKNNLFSLYENQYGYFYGIRYKECTETYLAPGCIFINSEYSRNDIDGGPGNDIPSYWTSTKSNTDGEGVAFVFDRQTANTLGIPKGYPVNYGFIVRCVKGNRTTTRTTK